ncbi:MAG: hypothetical protein HGB04_06660 [Chlorobiaceae bacterium]|nr:hypothetical protein [Chlorobiaceae bacterium]
MARKGRPKIDLYEKWVKGKEEVIRADCREGADLKGLARRLGCGMTTLTSIVRTSPQFRELIREDRESADLHVISALYRRAIGYEYEETVTKVSVGKNGEAIPTAVEKRKRHVPADTLAALAWLRNRRPEDWRDKKEVVVSQEAPSVAITREALVEEARKYGITEQELFGDE